MKRPTEDHYVQGLKKLAELTDRHEAYRRESAFLSHVHHGYALTDGTYVWPNTREGDMLRQAKKEIEAYREIEAKQEAHRMADTLVCEFLMGNGNCEIVKEFRRVKK